MKSMRNFLACLAAVMLASMLVGCDNGLNESIFMPTTESSISEESSILDEFDESEIINEEPEYQEPLEYAPSDYKKANPRKFELGMIFEEIDFLGLYNQDFGKKSVEESYQKFLYEVENGTREDALFWGRVTAYTSLMTSYGGESRNINIELVADRVGWKHELISTADDFALVSKDLETREVFVTGFVNGQLYDGLHLMGSEEYNQLIDIINENGYKKTMNSVRDEFWGGLWSFQKEDNINGYVLLSNSISEIPDGDISRIVYTHDEIKLWSNTQDKLILEFEPKYDIADSYIEDRYGDAPLSNKFGGEIMNGTRPSSNSDKYKDNGFDSGLNE